MKAGKLVKVRGGRLPRGATMVGTEAPWLPTPLDESRYGFLFDGPTVDIQNNWRPIETAQRFSMAHPKSLRPTLAVTL
jgi:hypothetical protein